MSPNPVTSRAGISFSLPHRASLSCVVYDPAGYVVSRLAAGTRAAGEHRLTWDATGVEPGVYFCKLTAGGSTSATRLTVVR